MSLTIQEVSGIEYFLDYCEDDKLEDIRRMRHNGALPESICLEVATSVLKSRITKRHTF